MSVKIIIEHVQLTLKCDECGEEWDFDDYDANSIEEAKQNAENKECSKCKLKEMLAE